MSAAAVFLDRDGTIIVDAGYPRDPEVVQLLPGAGEALRGLRAAGFRLVIVSNQSGIGRGLVTSAEAEAVHRRVISELGRAGVQIDAVRYCPHAPEDRCPCRKPAPGMLLDAARELDLDLPHSFMVGDRESDVEAGRAAGCRTILLWSAAADTSADQLAVDWGQAAGYIRSRVGAT